MYSRSMPNVNKFAALLLAAGLLLNEGIWADIYKCKDDDGNLMFSQTPCARQESVVVGPSESTKSDVDCSHANKFANTTARMMRRGFGSDEVFDYYGGLDSLSKGSVGVINYVYSFRTSAGVSLERIAGLAQAKCEARSFGNANCEALPTSFTESLGGCQAGGEENPASPSAQEPGPQEIQAELSAAPAQQGGADARLADRPRASVADEDVTEQCKKMYRDQIDAIDAQMRRGYSSAQGEQYREQLRGLTQKLRSC
ncbi:MAG: DUF4124 domain-containing protein [Gammaproteobacteria bacterium]|nr:DUF4124 domain-containing protein [Gammaproteobacteria bacterium]